MGVTVRVRVIMRSVKVVTGNVVVIVVYGIATAAVVAVVIVGWC